MKKLFSIAFFMFIVFACSHKTIPISNAPTPPPESKVVLENSTAAASTPMIEQGHTLYTTKCSKCHALKNTASYTAAAWDPIVKKMAVKAHLTEAETAQVTAYIMANSKK